MIGGHFDIGDCDHADARIFQLQPDDVRELALHLLRDAAAPGIVLRHGYSLLQRARDFNDLVDLELVANLDIVVVPQRQAALESRLHFPHVVLEALERVAAPRCGSRRCRRNIDLGVAPPHHPSTT